MFLEILLVVEPSPLRLLTPLIALSDVVSITFAKEVFLKENGVTELNAVPLRTSTTKLCNYDKPTKPLQGFLPNGHWAVNSPGLDEVWYDVARPKTHADGHVDIAAGDEGMEG